MKYLIAAIFYPTTSVLIVLGLDYLFPHKDMLYWKMGLSGVVGTVFNRFWLWEK
ncbi:hypothetical protein [Conchiformibius kuhniae]|uniref:Uncharacterized protein n=1 Tax=Conchiformibius kuhniae TaxID=211502 RepID=A0A8T9MUA3_9NEIS|nr:hypothetical protein [Conchiformibius kuhniae]UOP04684.1 hypothetical protein LVJ77_10900 [Conchiformibius kuhniae]